MMRPPEHGQQWSGGRSSRSGREAFEAANDVPIGGAGSSVREDASSSTPRSDYSSSSRRASISESAVATPGTEGVLDS